MASLGRGIAAALSGTLKGLAAGAEKEDARRMELTKTTLASTLKRKEAAREQHLANIEEGNKRTAAVDALMTVQYYDPNTKTYKSPTRAQALATYNTHGDKAVKALTDDGLYFEGEGKIIPGRVTKTGGVKDSAKDAIEEGKGLFGRGRGEAVNKEVLEYMKPLGIPVDGYEITSAPTVEGVFLRKPQEDGTRDISVHKSGVMRIEKDGKEQFVEGIIAGNGTYKIRQGGRLVDAPVGATFHDRPDPAPEQNVNQVFQDAYKAFGSNLITNRTELENFRAGAVKSIETMQQMDEIVSQNPDIFSSIATGVGGALKRVQTEIGGITFVFGDDGKVTMESVQNNLNLLDSFVEANFNSTDLAVKAQVLDAITIRTAYAFLQAQGETRPTDRDLRLAAEQLSAKSKGEFYQKMESSRRSLHSGLDNVYEKYHNSILFNSFQTDVSDVQRKARDHALKVFAPLPKPTIPTFEGSATEVVPDSGQAQDTSNLPKIERTPNVAVEHKTDSRGKKYAVQYNPQGGDTSRVIITSLDGSTKDMTLEQARSMGAISGPTAQSN